MRRAMKVSNLEFKGEMQMPTLLRMAIVFTAFAGLLALGVPHASAQVVSRLEFGASYDYVRSNAPSGECGCFSLNGGSGWVGYNLGRGLTAVGEVGTGRASDINGTSADLTLTSFLVGPKYAWRPGNRWVPFGQVLLGGAHANGGLTPAASGLAGSENAFAMTAGGGIDVTLTSHIALRALQADYYLTRFTNGGNDHQNNMRIGVGIVFRFGHKGH
jgi:outer membrane immunogenic protein